MRLTTENLEITIDVHQYMFEGHVVLTNEQFFEVVGLLYPDVKREDFDTDVAWRNALDEEASYNKLSYVMDN